MCAAYVIRTPCQGPPRLRQRARTSARYSREEALAALDWATLERKPSSFVAGVAWCDSVQTDALFVTLRKAERDYSPTTMYRDYAMSPELFHWESRTPRRLVHR